MSEHVWSGWPGAWCLSCGQEDLSEICAATHAHADIDPDRGICEIPCTNPPCPSPRPSATHQRGATPDLGEGAES